ncbi:MBL fold metallo-hydrolase [Gracilibacillus alcaliphilus]|uniref:MBL fold metallo-hydrolase n=1 Tax=Gracilibacillus alcaliphilus TaxID=1401441 RepID=UPI001959C205|nr:MBL fold metallo-hydrolase [Gracilibacillus alcaliphilus]MBM7677412.1 glyoxylase-like metal-dependent hydrolase (beta-lactamase superfamily II) [Gracilibacillus alcaliphilus]
MWNGISHNPSLKAVDMVEVITTGTCIQKEKLTCRTKRWRNVSIPAHCVIIHHPIHGIILFDTGYAEHFYQASQTFPYSLYRYATPIQFQAQDSASAQLLARGVDPKAVRYVILSHFHADHISGIRDFPNAKFIACQFAYQELISLPAWRQVKAGFLPELLPEDFTERLLPIESLPEISLSGLDPFQTGYDLLGDQTLVAINLPGHAIGQFGLWCQTLQQSYFLCADAAWSKEAVEIQSLPHWLTYLIIDDRSALVDSFQQLGEFQKQHPACQLIASHCPAVWKQKVRGDEDA